MMSPVYKGPRPTGGWTALICASFTENPQVVDVLIQCGANQDLKTNDGWMALISASFTENPQVVDVLIQCGANQDLKTNSSIRSAGRLT
ncbi:kinase D-interacting substrate of 220 kDa-like isoform X2 [Anneissia japonica]|uniref:kinase D-interacting substrate of 220 kDa-like isoform X2 n=1 Tax=Anneissia japonica TaxID=1529436 RepID=UPI0014256F88|nr:kinase D-interacting substrate of 220 kDa-like isoform X2 [Anneissia japonica]